MTEEDIYNAEVTDIRLSRLRLILQTFAEHRSAPTQAELAQASGVSADTITRFIRPDPINTAEDKANKSAIRRSTIEKQARNIARGLFKIVSSDGFVIKPEFEEIRPVLYMLLGSLDGKLDAPESTKSKGESDPEVPATNKIVTEKPVWTTRLPREPVPQETQASVIGALQGFWYLLRPETEADRVEGINQNFDISISLLNIVPPSFEKALHHPIFKIRQKGRQSQGMPFKFSGVLSARIEDAVFVGRRRSGDKFFSMVAEYDLVEHGPQNAIHVDTLRGVILGINSNKDNFCSPFRAFFIPGTNETVEKAGEEEITKQENRLIEGIGTFSPLEAFDALGEAGITLDKNNWNDEVIETFVKKRAFTI